ncbi:MULTISPECIES: DUF411 domain-containing protein [unclassified Diaphorobacter]|nr:hypothetical protein BV908_05325 [Diaphorobacter sp. LR2014-1]QYY24792.1 DUF411 domain-containing protein [Diaphorobacter sp. MNS-0]
MTTFALRRRQLGQWAAAGLGMLVAGSLHAQARRAGVALEVWKDANCGCCGDWITHMEQNGFKATVHDTGNNAVRARLGLATKYGSCHTALVGGYVVEGHVPAADVQRLLREKPQALGLAAPGMPVGSPGMDGAAYGGRRDRYDTLLVLRDGSSRVFQSHT